MGAPSAASAGAPPPGRGSVFERVAGFAHRHRWTAIGLWLLVLAGVQVLAGAVGDNYRDDHSIGGAESEQALELMREHGSAQAGDSVRIVLRDEAGLRESGSRPRVEAMLAEVAGLPNVAAVRSPYEDGPAVSPDGTTGYATVTLSVPSAEMPREDTERIARTAQSAAGDGLRVALGGDAARVLAEGEGGAAEGAGILAALVILVFMFGSVLAAGLPVIVAVFAVGSTLGVIVPASHAFTVASYTPYVMMLVGLGVGIDYALLVFARYRSELLEGADSGGAARRALDTAGRSVFFAGCVVIIALLGLMALGLGGLGGMALSVALTVLLTMLASLTLLPSLLALFGGRFERTLRARAARRAGRGRGASGDRWRRWGAAVQRRPVAALLVAVAALGALAVPALDLRLGFADAGNDPAGSTSREAYDLLAEGFGPGFNGPLVVVAHDGGGQAERAAREASGVLNGTPGVALATEPVPAGDGRVATVIVFPESAPQDVETSDLVHALRGEVLPRVAQDTGAVLLVGGATAAVVDFSDAVGERMPLFVAIVVGLSTLLLVAVFRSVLIPLKAAVLNLLSIGAALGAVTLVFQHGRLGVEPGPVEAFIPVMIFAIVFGLSMDYEVFLVSRMREEWDRTRDHGRAVREGLAHTGAIITAAAAIMIVVFGAFMLSDDRMLQQFGFGLAVAVLIDALVIRCLIVPAVLRLLGERSWWLPGPVGRVLPRAEAGRH
ncbi:MMPL family transporter [Streptomyces sodiiphilus]|uniref:MMPL family transporter n=1 Tax=Streptomyces sodiiphilus TaxID=226217 RepID=UPI0031D1FD00